MSSPRSEAPPSHRSPFAERAHFEELERGFDELSECSPAERRRRLDSLAATRPDLAADLAALLSDLPQSGGFLDFSAPLLASTLAEVLDELAASDPWHGLPSVRPGDGIGAWRLTRQLGVGGMGEVWEAERQEGSFAQTAALKLLKRGLESAEILRRFLQERQILAHLSHPGIARLLDGGVAADGRAFFVVEKVDGLPITRFAADHRLGIDARLRLVAACCRAVESAHQRLVVHRDLKPGNILVTAEGRPVLLDFGIAKVLSPDGDGQDTTQFHARVLTPDYAAPEQILGEPVSAATDVYALGVVLFELLAGELPHQRAAGSPEALVAAVSCEEVERPSRRVRRPASTGSTTLPIGSARERERWARHLEGDLDVVVVTALHRDTARRYPSAAALREDLERLLAGRPIAAHPDSAAYRARKFLARHAWGAAFAAALLLSLVGGLAATLWQSRRALAEAIEARRQSERAAEVEGLLSSMFEVSDPERSLGRTITAQQLLADGARKIGHELAGEPAVAARLLVTVAEVDRGLGLYAEAGAIAHQAIGLARRHLDPGDPVLLRALDVLAAVHDQDRDGAGAWRVAAEALMRARTYHAADSLEVARAAAQAAAVLEDSDRSAEALPLAREALRIDLARLGPDDLTSIRQLADVAVSLDSLEQYDESVALAKTALARFEARLGPEDPEVARVSHNLGSTLTWTGRYAEAEPYFRRAIAIRRKVLGANHPWLAFTLTEYAILLTREGRVQDSIDRSREALAIYRTIGPDEPHVPTCLNAIAVNEYVLGQYRGSLADFDAALAAGAGRMDAQGSAVLTWRANRGMALAQLGRLDEADRALTGAVASDRRTEGAESTAVAAMLRKLAAVKRLEGRLVEAEALQREALEITSSKLDPDSIPAAGTRAGLAQVLLERGGAARLAEAEREARRGLAAMEKVNPDHPRVLEGRKVLALVLLAAGAREEARTRLESLLADASRLGGEHAPETMEVRFWLAKAIDPSGRAPQSHQLLIAAYRDLRAAHGESFPLTRRAHELLAAPPAAVATGDG